MHRTAWSKALLLSMLIVDISALQASEPNTAKNNSSISTPILPGIRYEVVVRNLWDVLWNDPPSRVVTGKTQYGWQWLSSRFDKDANGIVTRDEFSGASELFNRLDRNWDGKLTLEDFDWTEKGTLGRQKSTTFGLFKSVDKNSDGRISIEEWNAVFSKNAREKGYLNDRELEELIFVPAILKAQREHKIFWEKAPPRSERLLNLIESGQLFTDGPEPGELAPDFSLRTADGKSDLKLSSYRGKKPVVLIFGSFT